MGRVEWRGRSKKLVVDKPVIVKVDHEYLSWEVGVIGECVDVYVCGSGMERLRIKTDLPIRKRVGHVHLYT